MMIFQLKKSAAVSIVLFGLLLSLLVPASATGTEVTEPAGGKEFIEGRRLQRSGEWEASIEQFRAAVDVYSIFSDYALYQMAQSAFQEGDTDLAATALARLLNLHADTPVRRKAQLDLANLYFSTGEYSRAAPLIEAALPGAESQEIAGLLMMLATAYAESGDLLRSDSICWRLIHGWSSTSEALAAAELVHAVDTPHRQLAVAKVYFLNKKASKALEIIERVLADPGASDLAPDLLVYKAQSLAHLGQKQVAWEIYDLIISDYPESSAAATAHFKRAGFRRSAGLLDDALADYAQVLERFTRHEFGPESAWRRARIFEDLNDPREYDEYERILATYPRSRLAFSSMMYWGVKLFKAGEYMGARRAFEKLLTADLGTDASANAAFWIAKCSVAEGNTNLAKVQLAGVIKRFGDSYQEFRARSVMATLDGIGSVYSEPSSRNWHSLFAYRDTPFVNLEAEGAEAAYTKLADALSYLKPDALSRLELLMVNELPEATWELKHLMRDIQGSETRYKLAWALYQTRAFNDSLKIASSLRGRFNDDRGTRIQYLLYPLAYRDLVGQAADRYEIDPLFPLSVMREESHFREEAISVSDARGLMQIIPSTGEWLAGKVFGPATFERISLFRPAVNIELGTYYLRYLLNKFDDNIVLALAAYNWGEGNLRRWMNDSSPGDLDVFVESIPAEETRRYVKKVMRSYAVYHSLYRAEYLVQAEE